MVDDLEFRADLFYRLSVFPVELPPLRERPEDIRLLVHHFAMDYADRMQKPIKGISEEFMTVLARHSWPGNVRELQNFIERSVILSTGAVLSGPLPQFRRGPKSAPVTLEDAERSQILQTLQQTGGMIGGRNGAAARLGMKRTTLISMMKRLGITFGQNSVSPVRAEASIPISEDPTLPIPPLSGISHEDACSSFPKSHVERVCTLAEAEREHISEVVEMTNGLIAGKGGAAEVLGVPPSTLRNRMRKLDIRVRSLATCERDRIAQPSEVLV
jgi:formate hydrogenlyase transcriptional activator